jgi:hypothetical protein
MLLDVVIPAADRDFTTLKRGEKPPDRPGRSLWSTKVNLPEGWSAESGDKVTQGPLPGQERVVKKDFNKDGVIDTLTTMADGGSGFGGDFVTLKDGKTGKAFTYNTWGSYGQLLRLIPFADELMRPENKGFKEALETALFPEIPSGNIDRSLAWLIDAYSQMPQESGERGDALFSQKIRFQPRWAEGEAASPGSYYCVTSDETLFRRFPIYQEDNPPYGPDHRQGWLVYYAANHQNLELACASDPVRVFKSAHGVVVIEGGRSCWVFVNDEVLTDGPPKLRWPSIKEVHFSDGLVFIHHAGGEEHLFVVDYRNGVAGRLKSELFPGAGGQFEVRDGQLILRGGVTTGAIGFETIKESLK